VMSSNLHLFREMRHVEAKWDETAALRSCVSS